MAESDYNPALRLAHALAEVYLEAREWLVACHDVSAPVSPHTIEERLAAKASAVAALQERLRLAEARIPGADEWIRLITGTRPGEYTSRIKTILSRLASVLVVHGHGLPPEGNPRIAWQRDIDDLHAIQLELKRLDYSPLPREISARATPRSNSGDAETPSGASTEYTHNLMDPWTAEPQWFGFDTIVQLYESHCATRRQLLLHWSSCQRHDGHDPLFRKGPIHDQFLEVVTPYLLFLDRHLDRVVEMAPAQQVNVAEIRKGLNSWALWPVPNKGDDPHEKMVARAVDLIKTTHRLAGRTVPIGVAIPDVDEMHTVLFSRAGRRWGWQWAGSQPESRAGMTRKPPQPVIELNESEQSIVEALREHGSRLTTEPLLTKALGNVNSNGKHMLARLVTRGILDNRSDTRPRGYGLVAWSKTGHDRGHD